MNLPSSPPPKTLRRLGAFTLMELLTAVALVAVLVVLGSVAGGRVTARSKSARCAGNLRQLFNGFMAYANDHGGAVPIDYVVDENTSIAKWVVYSGLAPYIPIPNRGTGYYEPYLCPSDRNPYFGFSYGVNSYLGRVDALSNVKLNRTIAWGRLSETFIIADAPSTVISANASSKFEARHDGRVNLVFLDGHVEARLAPLTSGSNAKNERFWNPRL